MKQQPEMQTQDPAQQPTEEVGQSTSESPASADELVQISEPNDSSENQIDADSSPQQLVEWGLQRFAEQSVVMTSSYGMEGCALMDMCSKAIEKHNLKPLTIACIDTGFFFPETIELQKQLIAKYTNLNFVTWKTPVSIEEQREKYGDLLWKNNPNMCCHIRKVQPMREEIVNHQIWITALRRSQTKQRADTQVLSWDWKYQLMKFCPIASWARSDVWNYIQENEVPFNQLHLQNFPSVSCTHCTKAVPGSSPESEVRDGRWAGKDKTECGLHYSI